MSSLRAIYKYYLEADKWRGTKTKEQKIKKWIFMKSMGKFEQLNWKLEYSFKNAFF